jgi:glucosamine-6-phosphate deaminase
MAATIVAREIEADPRVVLGLSADRSLAPVYAALADMHKNDGLDFSQVTTFNLGEYIGVPQTDDRTCRQYMHSKLFDHVNMDERRIFLPNGMAEDLNEACAAYEELIRDNGGIDVQVLGIGKDGHIGFNDPLSAMLSRTRPKALTPPTMQQNAAPFEDEHEGLTRAIAMGVGTIMEADRCLLFATGSEKSKIIAEATEGPVTSMISASALQFHNRCTVILDEAAANGLENIEQYEWAFANEPEWKDYR